MGACDFTNVAIGKTAQEAFNQAVEDAAWEHGHGGYSGTIAEKHGYVLFTVPPRLSIDKLLGWVSEFDWRGDDGGHLRHDIAWAKERVANAKPGTVRAAKKQLREAEQRLERHKRDVAKFKREVGPHYDLVKRIYEVFDDKWGPAVAIEVTSPAQKKKYLRNSKPKRGQKIFIFTGMASS